MRVPSELAKAFDESFERIVADFLAQSEWIGPEDRLDSRRFLMRSIVPHVERLSRIFNRLDEQGGPEDGDYWKAGGNSKNRRLAYFLGFMPPNLFRVASVWAELARLGWKWPELSVLKAIDLGSGPATSASGVFAAEKWASTGMPSTVDWALIDRDSTVLNLGEQWLTRYAESLGFTAPSVRTFTRKLDVTKEILPRAAPKFNLWTQSYFLNESLQQDAGTIADAFLNVWRKHLEEESLVIWIEPALKAQSRALLNIRHEILKRRKKHRMEDLQILLPCLGHQACGALSEPTDWCHEEVVWWRPPYLKKLDEMVKLDRKSLPFSYLVFAKSSRSLGELLPALEGSNPPTVERLVSPSILQGRDQEFFICGQTGKRRARFQTADELSRGDILTEVKARGAPEAVRIEQAQRVGEKK